MGLSLLNLFGRWHSDREASMPSSWNYHYHACEWCGCTFSHDKRLIAPGRGHEAHLCPACGRPVNVRLDSLGDLTLDYADWYGVGNHRRPEGSVMLGRVRGVAVSSSSVELAKKSLDRTAIVFSVGEATNAASVMLKDQEDATATNGFPLTFSGGPLRIEGKLARHRWSAIRLAALDCVVGVIEEFPPESSDDEKDPQPAVNT